MVKVLKNSPSLIGRYKSLGLTFYRRGDEIVARSSCKSQPTHQTTRQFRSRERVRRIIALWSAFPATAKPVMDTPDGLISYRAFQRINVGLPMVYLTRQQHKQGGAVLVPGLCVSAGQIDPVGYAFETIPDGQRLLVTSIATGLPADLTQPLPATTPKELSALILDKGLNKGVRSDDVLRFYSLRQTVKHTDETDVPLLNVACADIPLIDDDHPFPFLEGHLLYTHRGFLAVACPDEGADAYAVALLAPRYHTASTQYILTTSTFHEAFTTDEALARAADSYGNVRDNYLTPEPQER